MLNNQKPSGEKLGLGFNSFEASSSGTKEIKFVKAQKKVSPDGGPINMGGPLNVQAAPKVNMGPPPGTTPGSEKSVSFQKSILGPRPKHIIVNNVRVPVASDNEVKQFYKPLSKPGICLRVDLEPDEWIKDSECSKHMTNNRKLFSSYKAYNGGNVIFGSNLRGNIIGKGQICDNKCRVTFSEHDSEITKDGKVIGRGIRKKGLYVMKLGNEPKDKICLATIDENSMLWHRRLGHANMRLIQSLASKELVRNLPKLKFDQHFCDACKIGKQAHASHKAKNIVLTTRCLELLYMDLFGPSAVRSYEGNRYTLVIVDDYSRYTWTRFLKDKTEAFDQFEIFSKKIQNQLGCTIVSIRTDHDREFDNEVQFGEFCNANGVTHNFSAPHTPQSNGVVKRKNRTLQEMSRTMLNEQSLPQNFWCNTVDTSTYILNRILIRAILGKTPYELLRGRKPTLDYFRVFGSKCFILNNKDYLTKFDPKSYEGIFLGYSQNSKAYIILNKHTRKVKESLNVTFDETPPPSKTSPLVDDDLDEEEAIKVTEKKNLESDTVDETLGIEEIVNIKESRNHALENVIGNLTKEPLDHKPKTKARLVAQGYNQQEGIDYDETYTLVARLESIRILLDYACALDFKLFQMDVKSAFLNGFINEDVYVAQPLGFFDFEKTDHVYKLKKGLYGLKQTPKAWYDRLKAFLIKHEYKMGMVDNTLFTKKRSSNLIIVQIYVDDIIFGSTCQDMCDEFSKIMHDEFEMSMMGELNFFLGLQIKQMEDGIFFNQSKYIKEMLKKFSLEESKPMKTPMSSDTKLMKDEECESVDSTKYRGMIGSLLYLMASRPDIMFSVCLCARFQEAPKTSHLKAVKRIFRYIKGTTHLGLWYPKGTDIETVVYADSNHVGYYVDQKSTSGICTFLGCCLISWFSKKQTALAISTTEAEYKLRIEKNFQVQDYALWDVIENGNSFKPAAQTTTNAEGTLTTLVPGPVTVDEKTQKKNDVKARSMLLMAHPNEHLLTFNQYNAPSTESLDSIFNRLQKIRNKPDLDTMSFDDLYNNFKIVKQEVKGTTNSSLSSSSQNMAFISSPSSTNEVNTGYGVSTDNIQDSTASTQVSTASTQVSTANLSDATIYAFLANQLNGSHRVHEDLEQIHEDDLEEMDLKWECRGPRNQDNISRNQNSSRRTINVEEISSKAMLAIDTASFDWSFMTDKEVPTYMALMAFLDSEPEFEGYGSKTSKSVSEDISNEIMKSPDALLVEELVLDDKLKKKTVFPTVSKIEFVRPQQQEKLVGKPVKLTAITIKRKGWYLGVIIQG
ncbi:retrovirus-related pol polyprotein from transposon TNT 1-94 [Tanacetum coccineum]